MRRDTIKCSVTDCWSTHTEARYNEGHPNWGHIIGIIDQNGEEPHLCPACLDKIKLFLEGKK